MMGIVDSYDYGEPGEGLSAWLNMSSERSNSSPST